MSAEGIGVSIYILSRAWSGTEFCFVDVGKKDKILSVQHVCIEIVFFSMWQTHADRMDVMLARELAAALVV